ncbi:mitochondrial large ribosomal subunit [Coemansia javaensis]|uniref:Large ribosomal subunit protein mL49 n=1 Tax=Coemansia javaensis TaxID=2761396 RepID=A0A9W8HHE3_9FUNG|nr:mitochondrial large ribosomal subunit [Coemansia javaensis]
MLGLPIARPAPRPVLRPVLRALESTLAATPKAGSNAEPKTYPYYVRRTRFQSLPVYTDVRNGGTRRQTVVRRIEGDLGALRADLAAALSDESIAVKSASQQLLIKGDCARQVREWLTARGF